MATARCSTTRQFYTVARKRRQRTFELNCRYWSRVSRAESVSRAITSSSPEATPATNLFLTLLDGAGIRVETFGDSTGRLDLRG